MPYSVNPIQNIRSFKNAMHFSKTRNREELFKEFIADKHSGVYVKGKGWMSFVTALAYAGDEGTVNFLIHLTTETRINKEKQPIDYKVLYEAVLGYALNNDQGNIARIFTTFAEQFVPRFDPVEIGKRRDLSKRTMVHKDHMRHMTQALNQGTSINSYNIFSSLFNSNAGKHPLYFEAIAGRIAIEDVIVALEKEDKSLLSALILGGHKDIISKTLKKLPPALFKQASRIVEDEFKLTSYPNQNDMDLVADYQIKRDEIKEDYYHSLSRFFGGISKQEKLAAASALFKFMAGETTIDTLTPFKRALNQGELGKIYAKISPKFEFFVDQPNNAALTEKSTLTI